MFGWVKKIKKRKKEDDVFVIMPEDVVHKEVVPNEMVMAKEEAKKFKEEVTIPSDQSPEALKEETLEDWLDIQEVKGVKKKKENAKPKKNATEDQPNADLGKLNLRKHTITKRQEYLAERKKYEREYLARLKKQPKTKPKKSVNLKHEPDLGKLNLRKHTITKRQEYLAERKKYEREYLARLKKQPKTKPKKRHLPRKRK